MAKQKLSAQDLDSWNKRGAKQRDGGRVYPVQARPHYILVSPGLSVGYCACEGVGRWAWRDENGKVKRFAKADDFEPANGDTIMSVWQAIDYAKKEVRGDNAEERAEAVTVGEALKLYEEDLAARGRAPRKATTAYNHIKRVQPELLERDVRKITKLELEKFRNKLLASPGINGKDRMGSATWNNFAKGLATALRRRVKNRPDIFEPLAMLDEDRSNEEAADNVVLTDKQIDKLIAAAYGLSFDFGVLIHCLETTGARASQAVRLLIKDLHGADTAEPWLSMPKSGKGGTKFMNKRKAERIPVQITVSLAQQLKASAKGRRPTEYLLLKNGKPWAGKKPACEKYWKLWNKVLELAEIPNYTDAGKAVTAYCLRHTSITRMLLAMPVVQPRVVASHHDTSVQELEKHYSVEIMKQEAASNKVRAVLREHGAVIGIGHNHGPALDEAA